MGRGCIAILSNSKGQISVAMKCLSGQCSEFKKEAREQLTRSGSLFMGATDKVCSNDKARIVNV